MNLVSAEREADVREVPVWKSTYRLVLDAKAEKGPLLQGWVIVDNLVGEDWNNVELSLVADAPQSFIQNLSQLYYVQRPTVELPSTVSVKPQTYESTLMTGQAQLSGVVRDAAGAAISGATVKVLDAGNTVIAQADSNAAGAYEFQKLPSGTLHLEVQSRGFQTASIANFKLDVRRSDSARCAARCGECGSDSGGKCSRCFDQCGERADAGAWCWFRTRSWAGAQTWPWGWAVEVDQACTVLARRRVVSTQRQ